VERARSYLVFGLPQAIAVALLMAFIAQGAWLISRRPFSAAEQDHIWAGRQQLEAGAIPRVFTHTPLVNIAAAAPMRIDRNRSFTDNPTPERVQREVRRLRWLLRLPFLFAGVLLGVSIWYVARRLYGNSGGYIALALYCFSPVMVIGAASIDEGVPASWGAFGVIFTAIAISHNLYAPPKKWRYRTLLLALSMVIALTSHPATVVLLPLAIVYMMYLTPGRRLPATLVIVVSGVLAAVGVFAIYSFEPGAMRFGMDLREWLAYNPGRARILLFSDWQVFLARFNPAIEVLTVVCIVTFGAWHRTQYFGNSAPLLTAGLLLYLSMLTLISLHATIWALPFLFVFIGGICADLLETRRWKWALAAILVLLFENAWFCLWMMKNSIHHSALSIQ
jgi:hypothetical protein